MQRGRLCPDGMLCTPARRGPTFPCAKVGKTQSRGTGSPLTSPFLSLAVLDTNDAFASSVRRTDTLPRWPQAYWPPLPTSPPLRGRGRECLSYFLLILLFCLGSKGLCGKRLRGRTHLTFPLNISLSAKNPPAGKGRGKIFCGGLVSALRGNRKGQGWRGAGFPAFCGC